MKKCFYYLFYRLAKYYEDSGLSMGNAEHTGMSILFGTLSFFVSSLALILFNICSDNFMILFYTIQLPFLLVGLILAYKYEGLYEKLKEYYKNEKHPKLKNFLMFLYIMSSGIIFFITAWLVYIE